MATLADVTSQLKENNNLMKEQNTAFASDIGKGLAKNLRINDVISNITSPITNFPKAFATSIPGFALLGDTFKAISNNIKKTGGAKQVEKDREQARADKKQTSILEALLTATTNGFSSLLKGITKTAGGLFGALLAPLFLIAGFFSQLVVELKYVASLFKKIPGVDKVKNISKQISESDNAENIGYKTTQVKDIQFNNQQILDKARQRAFNKKVNLLKETGNLVLEADDAIRIEDAIKEIEKQTGEEVDRSQIETNPANFQFEIYNKDNVNEVSEKYNIPVKDLMEESDGSYIAQEGTILMSEEAADGVLEHESGHMYLDIGLSKKENQNLVFSMAEVVKQEIDKADPEIGKILDTQLERYKKDPRYTAKDVAEEVLTYYLQLKKQGVLGNQDAVNTETSNILKKIYNSLGFGKTKPINLNKDNVVYLLDDYLNSLKNGKLNKQQKEFARGNLKYHQS